jgi:mannose-6-phosphate isomerase-like protein (cupin superfamily)
MDAFELDDLLAKRSNLKQPYLEFLHVPSMSAGLYVIPAGGVDTQEPHEADELYYVVSGRASLEVGSESRTVEAGTVLYVAANVKHRFHTIEEDLTLLVVYAHANMKTPTMEGV